MEEQPITVVQEIHSVPTTITLDKRRADQIAHLARGQGKTIAAWLEEVTRHEWDRWHPGMTNPSMNLFSKVSTDGRVSAGVHFKPLTSESAIFAAPATAQELAHMLYRAAEGRGAIVQVVGCDDGQRVTVSRKGNGIVVQIDNIDSAGAIYRHVVGMTPSLAEEYASSLLAHADHLARS